MYNPFYPFTLRLLEPMLAKNNRYFVLQSFRRSRSLLGAQKSADFLLTHYTDSGRARDHFDAIRNDADRRLFNMDIMEDRKALVTFLDTENGNQVYAHLTTPDWKEKAVQQLNKKWRAYIQAETNWNPRREDEINPDMEIIFGEVYMVLSFRAERLRVKLEDIEMRY